MYFFYLLSFFLLLSYFIRNVQYHQDNIYDSLSTSEEALVLENIDEELMSSIPLRASTHKKMLLGSSIRLEGIVSQSYFCSGKNAQVEVHVTNNTKHKVISYF